MRGKVSCLDAEVGMGLVGLDEGLRGFKISFAAGEYQDSASGTGTRGPAVGRR